MYPSDIVFELAKRMVGKTVVAVEDPCADEAIALFKLSDGTRFRLHATDLGAWIEKTSTTDGTYDDLTVLLQDYSHHSSSLAQARKFRAAPEPRISFSDGVLELEDHEDGTVFRGTVARFKPRDQRVVHHNKGLELLVIAAPLGDAWRTFLNHHHYPDICPKELSRADDQGKWLEDDD